ncbi:MAG TPA: Flp pilus assembly protein CpaB [Gaiellaceae bacterium]
MTKYRVRNISISVALAALGALLVALYVISYRKDVNKGAESVTVLVATHDIPQGTAGTSVASGGYLETQTVLRRNVVPGAISKGAQLSGLVVGSTIYEGEQVTVRQFKPVAQGGIFSSFSGTERAMLIPGDPDQVLSGLVSAGDRVDVVANVGGTTSNNARAVTRTVLQNVLVLKAPETTDTGLATSAQTSITLALTVSEAQRMFFALKNADWWLTLRPTARPKTPPATVETYGSFLGHGLSGAAGNGP